MFWLNKKSPSWCDGLESFYR